MKSTMLSNQLVFALATFALLFGYTDACALNYTVDKSCQCEFLTQLTNTSTIITTSPYGGINETQLNTTLQRISTWDQKAVILLCKQAKCDEAMLVQASSDIELSTNTTMQEMESIKASKELIRIAIDCSAYSDVTRDHLYGMYETLCDQYVILKNVYEDLKIKTNIIMKETQRCQNRSWLRQVLEAMSEVTTATTQTTTAPNTII